MLLSDLSRPPDPPVLLLLGAYHAQDAAVSHSLRSLLSVQQVAEAGVDRPSLPSSR